MIDGHDPRDTKGQIGFRAKSLRVTDTTGRDDKGACVALLRFAAVLFIAAFAFVSLPSSANAETRTLKLYFLHTKERAAITYKKNGRYIPSGLKKINRFLRDWRRNEPTKMDPRLLDLVWEVYRKSGSRGYIHVISAYRSPATNSMLRKRGRGVAKKSQHMLGKALDFYLPDVKLSKLRRVALKMEGGGVGYYPRSGSPFVHLDVGNVRHWPRMSRSQLMAMFPGGKTIHLPRDGKPLPGYKTALANYNKRKKRGSSYAVASASSVALSSRQDDRGFLSTLFGGGADEEEENSAKFESKPKATKSKAKPETRTPAAPVAEPEKKQEEPSVEQLIAALPARSIPKPVAAPRPVSDTGVSAPLAGDGGGLTVEETTEQIQLAYVPTPSRRPNYNIASVSEQIPDDVIARLLRSANEADKPEKTFVTALAPAPRPRADVGSANKSASNNDLRQLRVGSVDRTIPQPTPAARPEKSIRLASLPSVSLPEVVPAPEEKGATAPKTSRLALNKSLRARMLKPADLKAEIKVAPKKAKPDTKDVQPDPKAVTVPVDSEETEWAFRASKVPEIRSRHMSAQSEIRQQPTVVYKLGFGEAPNEGDVRRFTGNAVTFLSIARFSKVN